MIPIVMKTWAGADPRDFEYAQRSLPSLLKSDLPEGTEVVIFDDCSTDPRLGLFLKELADQDKRVRLFCHSVNKGPNRGQAEAYVEVARMFPDAPLFVNVDDDVIYHRSWLRRLLEAKHVLNGYGMSGILTALNMPFRRPFARLKAEGGTYLFKWKQPALNWLISREIYERVGPFVDEGIAYDTVYSHWLRLHGYPIICLKPSYAQNIGAHGAYSVDGTTTADDFVGEGDGYRFPRRAGQAFVWHAASWGRRFQRRRQSGLNMFAPVRWGSELVYEGWVGLDRRPVAYFHADDTPRLTEVQRIQHENPYGIRCIHRRSADGLPAVVECGWRFLPSLRDCRKYPGLAPTAAPGDILKALVAELIPFHSAGVVHNKVRLENVYWDRPQRSLYLAWLGTEPVSGRGPLMVRERAIELFGSALDRWADAEVREGFAARYLATVAPEVLAGEASTPASDVYAVAAMVLLFFSDQDIATVTRVNELREGWTRGAFRLRAGLRIEPLEAILRKCLAADPRERYRDALELQKALVF